MECLRAIPGQQEGEAFFETQLGSVSMHSPSNVAPIQLLIKAELYAVLHGLQEERKLGITKLIIEVDTSEVVAILEKKTYGYHHLSEKGGS